MDILGKIGKFRRETHSDLLPFPVRALLRFLKIFGDGFRFGAVNRHCRPQVIRSCFEYWALAIRRDLAKVYGNSHDPERPFHVLGMNLYSFSAETLFALISEIFLEREYAVELAADEPVIFDCGSNIGISILFFKQMYPRAKITGFEPDKKTFELLKRNVAENGLKDVSLHNVALSFEAGEAAFYSDSRTPGSLIMSLFKERMDGEARKVPCAPLSSFVQASVDLLKMDIEGAEMDVLRELAASGALSNVKYMVIEYHHKTRSQDRLSEMLLLLDECSFGYDVAAVMPYALGNSQDVLLRIYRRGEAPPESRKMLAEHTAQLKTS
jgi:FkbM family methyltransferase